MRDAAETLDLTLNLPVRGKTYRVLPPPAQVGVRLMELLRLGLTADALAQAGAPDAAAGLSIDLDGMDFPRDCLGPVYDEMLADGVPAPMLELAIGTAFFAWTAGMGVAEAWWESGGKAPAPGRMRRPTGTPTPPAGASTTRRRASANGTSRRRPPAEVGASSSSGAGAT